jgi:hypothetical protein
MFAYDLYAQLKGHQFGPTHLAVMAAICVFMLTLACH